ncbi:MAG: hypothetical protein AAGL23_01135 [Pseudomonadota bacterium]
MTAKRIRKGASIALCVVALIGCDAEYVAKGNSFQSQYTQARTALEKGNYNTANRLYGDLMGNAGPLENRIQLELSHSHLRAGQFNAAAQVSGALANQSEDTARSAALSVHGTAMHELGLALLAQGDLAAGKTHLKSAQQAFDEVLREDPKLDPLGSLAGRKAAIAARLNALQ